MDVLVVDNEEAVTQEVASKLRIAPAGLGTDEPTQNVTLIEDFASTASRMPLPPTPKPIERWRAYMPSTNHKYDEKGRAHKIVDTGRNERCTCGSGKKFKRCCDGKAPLEQPTLHSHV